MKSLFQEVRQDTGIYAKKSSDLQWNYKYHRTRKEPLVDDSNFIFEEVNKDSRRSRKEELSNKFKELFKKRKETLEKEKLKGKTSIKCTE